MFRIYLPAGTKSRGKITQTGVVKMGNLVWFGGACPALPATAGRIFSKQGLVLSAGFVYIVGFSELVVQCSLFVDNEL
jgi:hypothetical protein